MKVALISPRSLLGLGRDFQELWRSSPELRTFHEYMAGLSVGLLICASYLSDTDSVELMDENLQEIDFNSDYDLVMITGMTHQAQRSYQIADHFKARGAHVLLGGIHASVVTTEAMEHADTVIVGEAEESFPRFLGDLRRAQPKAVYRAGRPVDLAQVPVPRYDLVAGQRYKVVWVQASRGCPRDCHFCSVTSLYGRKIRHKPVSAVIQQVREASRALPHALVAFADDNMFTDRSYARELVDALSHESLRWFAQTDISIADDPDLLDRLKDAGCTYLFLGLESLRGDDLSQVDSTGWKARQRSHYERSIARIQDRGIAVFGSFIVGFDADDLTVFREVSDFVKKTRMFATLVNALTPIPGSALRTRLKREGRVLSDDWALYNFQNVVIEPRGMSAKQLQDGIMQVYREIYNPVVGADKARYFKSIFRRLA